MIYVVTDKTTGTEVFRYSAEDPEEWGGMGFSTHTHTPLLVEEQAVQATRFNGRRLLSKLEFRSLFPETALKAIDRFEVQFESAPFLSDTQKDDIRTAFKDYNEASGIDLDDPRWIPGLGLYVVLGYLTNDEMTGVLRG